MRPSTLLSAWWLVGALPMCGCSVLTSYDGLLPEGTTAGPSSGAGAAGSSSSSASSSSSDSSSASAGPGVGGGGAGTGGTGGTPPMGYADIVLADHPVAYWRLGETEGTIAADATGAGHSGAYSGNFQLGVQGAINGDADTALGLDGWGQVLVSDVFDFTGLAPHSVEAWVRVQNPPPPDEYMGICGKVIDTNGVNGYLLSTKDEVVGFGRWSFDAWDGGDGVDGFLGQLGSYSHVVATFDGTTMYLYVNGGQVDGKPTDKDLADRADAFIIGAAEGGYEQHMHGDIDEVAVYDYALPPDRVVAHYQAGVQ